MKPNFELYLKAVSFASAKHSGQFRKNGVTPYIAHPLRVAFLVQHLFGLSDPQILATAVLHDTLEDTGTDFDELEEVFNRTVAEGVAVLSKDKRLPAKKREAVYAKAVVHAPLWVQVIKLADLCDNFLDSPRNQKKARYKIREKMQRIFGSVKKSRKRELSGYLKKAGTLIDGD